MTLPQIIYCQTCHIKGKQQPAAWALIDPTNLRKADFYCFSCLATEDIDIDECETIEAYRKMVADGVPPKPTPVAASGALCDCGRPKGHRGRHRGTGLSFIRNKKPKAIDKQTAYTASGDGGSGSARVSGQGTEPSVQTTPQNGSNRKIDVGGFTVRVITMEEYRLTGCREAMSDLDPIVAYVRTMKAGTVALWDTPKGKALKAFRERLGRALQKVHKIPVRVEMRKAENAVAIIREAQ